MPNDDYFFDVCANKDYREATPRMRAERVLRAIEQAVERATMMGMLCDESDAERDLR